MASGLRLTVLCLAAGLWFAASGGNADQDDCDEPCPSGWTHFNTRCFLFQPDKKDWADAERFCTQYGGNLASIQTKEEFDFLKGMIRKHAQEDAETWVGGHDGIKEGVWLWSDGSHFEFSLWDKGEPNDFFGEDCMELNQKGKKFANDGDCDGKMPFVCAMALGQESEVCETCPDGWINFEKSCYQFHFAVKDWADAERLCTSVGGNLASVHSKEEYDFLRNTVFQLTGQHTDVWLGGYDAVKEGVWLWRAGSHFDFKLWHEGEPSNYGGKEHCMDMNLEGQDYVNDNTCDKKISFVCKKQL